MPTDRLTLQPGTLRHMVTISAPSTEGDDFGAGGTGWTPVLTARAYLEALEDCFLLFRAEAHRPTEHKVLTAHPRIFATDLGLAGWANRAVDSAASGQQLGALLENQVAHALAASCDWGIDRIAVRHWRDQRSKREVDLLLVHPDGRAVPIEIKAARTVGPADTQGLVAFADSNRESFHRGCLAYCGAQTVDLTPAHLPARSIVALPLHEMLTPA